MFEPTKKIKNAHMVINFLRKWPSFHDAEVLKVELDRKGPSLDIKFYTFLMLKEVDERGYYKLDKECIIAIRFYSIEGLELVDFNEQNVISSLDFQQIESGGIKVIIHPCYGLNGEFICKDIEIISVEKI